MKNIILTSSRFRVALIAAVAFMVQIGNAQNVRTDQIVAYQNYLNPGFAIKLSAATTLGVNYSILMPPVAPTAIGQTMAVDSIFGSNYRMSWQAAGGGGGGGTAWSLTGNTAINPAINFLGTTDGQPVIFRTNNTERMRILSTGNIGIGITNPSQKLQVDGNILISGGNQLQISNVSGFATTFTTPGGQTSNINYTLPSALPSANGFLQTNSSGTLSWFGLPIGASLLKGQMGVPTRIAFWSDTSELSHDANLFWDNTNKRVGVGTANPSQPLHVVGNILVASTGGVSKSLQLQNPAATFFTSFKAGAQVADITYTTPIALPPINGFMQTNTSGTMTWQPIPSGQSVITGKGAFTRVAFWSDTNQLSSNANMYWDDVNSRLGIGTSSPLQPLQLKGNALLSALSGSAPQLQMENPAGTFKSTFQAGAQTSNINYLFPLSLPASTGYLVSSSTGNLNWQAIPFGETLVTGAGTATRVAFWTSSSALGSNSNLFWDNTNSRLGIGENNPTQPLHVKGNILIASNGGSSNQLQLQDPAGVFSSTFKTAAQVTAIDYTLPGTKPTANQVLTVASVAGTNVTLDWVSSGGSSGWSLIGNGGTTAGTNYVGTTDNKALEIHVNETDAANQGSKRVMKYEPNATSANIIGGFQTNSVTAGKVGGVISGGGSNGSINSVTDDYGVIVGGLANSSGKKSFVGGGETNLATGIKSVVAGGETNTAGGITSVISGGSNNTASGDSSSILGGRSNTASGKYSSVLGGLGLKLGTKSVGYSGQSGVTQTDVSSTSNIAYFGDVNMWIGNTTSSAAELRFYEPNSSTTYSSTNFTSFKAGTQNADINYTLPLVAGGSNEVMHNDGSGNLSWSNAIAGGNLSYTTSSPGTYGGNQNNTALGVATASVFRISSTGAINLTGIDAAGVADGRFIVLINIGGNAITLMNNDGNSTAANRFRLKAATLVLNADEVVQLMYDGATQRWRPIATY
ncbi:MAG: hypothetical protein HYZ54_02485 [Ignavibacteriae bacterium]|nr:hypothetical protein [Ignavibacteriota bacterium]